MAAISGLQAPNPYAQATPVQRTAPARAANDNGTHQAVQYHSAYSPDWMQAEHAAAASQAAPALYGAKGELRPLPTATPQSAAPATSGETVTDRVEFSNRFRVEYAAIPGIGHP